MIGGNGIVFGVVHQSAAVNPMAVLGNHKSSLRLNERSFRIVAAPLASKFQTVLSDVMDVPIKCDNVVAIDSVFGSDGLE